MKKQLHIYRHLGYFNEVGDIRELSMKSADEIIDYWKKGYGAFFEDDWADSDSNLIEEEEGDNVFNNTVRFTSDKKYAIYDSSGEKWKKEYEDSEDGDDSGCYIDVYEFAEVEDYVEEEQEICIPCDSCKGLNWIKNDLRIYKCEYCGKYFVNCEPCKNKELNYSCENCPLKLLAALRNQEIEDFLS